MQKLEGREAVYLKGAYQRETTVHTVLCHFTSNTLYNAGFIMEHKCPIVSLHFLNEWGDLQVVPYKAKTPEGTTVQRL